MIGLTFHSHKGLVTGGGWQAVRQHQSTMNHPVKLQKKIVRKYSTKAFYKALQKMLERKKIHNFLVQFSMPLQLVCFVLFQVTSPYTRNNP